MLHFVTTLLAVLHATDGVFQVAGTPSTINRRANIPRIPAAPVHTTQNTNGKNATGSTPKTNHTAGTDSPDSGTGTDKTITLSPADITATLGAVTPGGCKKSMNWESGSQGYDKDQIAERFKLYNNVWGGDNTAAGSKQVVKCNKFQNGFIDWTTSFNLKSKDSSKDNQVKSFSNIAYAGRPVQISALKKFEASWHWNLTGKSDDLVADVSFDMFTSKSATCTGQGEGCASHEIMVWLQAIGGAGPAGAQVPGKTVRVGPHHFNVFKGIVGNIPVISIVPVEKKAYHRFDVDFIPLLQKELTEFGLDPSEYVSTVGAGIEPFKGIATLDNEFSMVLL